MKRIWALCLAIILCLPACAVGEKEKSFPPVMNVDYQVKEREINQGRSFVSKDVITTALPEVTEEQQAEKDALFSELDRLKDPDALTDDDMIAGAYAPYWKWLADYDALKEAEGIAEPCLLLQGEEDYQVTMEDFAIWQEAVGEKENWQLISYPGLIHAFTQGQKTEGAAAYSRNEKVDPQVIEDIAGFISSFGAAAGTSS